MKEIKTFELTEKELDEAVTLYIKKRGFDINSASVVRFANGSVAQNVLYTTVLIVAE
jgi:hypothetical protein